MRKTNYSDYHFDDQASQRQSLHISARAMEIIEHDSAVFMDNPTPAGFINHLLQVFKYDSIANIDYAVKVRMDEYRTALAADPLTKGLSKSDIDHIVNALSKPYRKVITDQIQNYPKDKILKIYLQNENFAELADPNADWRSSGFYKKQGHYINALIEDYCSKGNAERERIFFKDTVHDIENTIDAGHLMEVTTKNASGNKLQFILKPFGLLSNKEGTYNYLVGITINNNGSNNNISSYRLSRIRKIKNLSKAYGSGKLSKEDVISIKDKIKTQGVPYLLGKSDDIKILLTKEGQEKFQQILFLRPQPVDSKGEPGKNPGERILTFNCSELQAEQYFLRLGKDAIVLSPESLRKKLTNFFLDAYNSNEDIRKQLTNDGKSYLS